VSQNLCQLALCKAGNVREVNLSTAEHTMFSRTLSGRCAVVNVIQVFVMYLLVNSCFNDPRCADPPLCLSPFCLVKILVVVTPRSD
jgi:hypothetical protein